MKNKVDFNYSGGSYVWLDIYLDDGTMGTTHGFSRYNESSRQFIIKVDLHDFPTGSVVCDWEEFSNYVYEGQEIDSVYLNYMEMAKHAKK